jgi:hypothetical protein
MKNLSRNSTIIKSSIEKTARLMISVPLTGLIRAEWALGRYGQAIPCNWSQSEVVTWMDQLSPLGFLVADARNIAVENFMKGNYEWLFFIDHDVVMPPNVFVTWNQYMLDKKVPLFGGLYFTKSVPSEPLLYRGLGTSYVTDWKMGDKVWVNGMGLGCHMIHRSILEVIYKESGEYSLGSVTVRRVFTTPSNQEFDAEKNAWITSGGTEDISFYHRLIDDKILAKAGWPEYQKMKYPYLCDTSIFCRHIDWNGIQYPSQGEEQQFAPKPVKVKKVKR